MTRSSTSSQPIAIFPFSDSSSPRSSRARSSTTVLATESARPKTRPAPRVQPQIAGGSHPEERRQDDLGQRPRQGDPADLREVVEREVQPDSEHEEHDPDLRQLLGEVEIGHEARGGRTDQHAGDQVADDRRQLQPQGEEPEEQGSAEGDGDGGDQGELGVHRDILSSAGPARDLPPRDRNIFGPAA